MITAVRKEYKNAWYRADYAKHPEKYKGKYRRWYKHNSVYFIEWRKKHPGIERKYALKKLYGITPEEYSQMLIAQEGVCKICKQPETRVHKKTGKLRDLCVDHEKGTKKIRGLLCNGCNAAIGMLKHDIDRLKAAIVYLEAAQ